MANIYRKSMNIIYSMLLSLCVNLPSVADDHTPILENYLNTEADKLADSLLNTDSKKQLKATLTSIKLAANPSDRLFQPVADKLQEMAKVRDSKITSNTKKKLEFYAEALAISGQDKYIETLQMLSNEAASRKLQKAALKAIGPAESFKAKNQLIADGLSNLAEEDVNRHSVSTIRFSIHLNSNNFDDIWMAAKEIFINHNQNDQLSDLVLEKLLDGYNNNIQYGTHVDSMAYMIKILQRNGNSKYIPELEKIRDSAISNKIKKYATKSLEHWSKSYNN